MERAIECSRRSLRLPTLIKRGAYRDAERGCVDIGGYNAHGPSQVHTVVRVEHKAPIRFGREGCVPQCRPLWRRRGEETAYSFTDGRCVGVRRKRQARFLVGSRTTDERPNSQIAIVQVEHVDPDLGLILLHRNADYLTTESLPSFFALGLASKAFCIHQDRRRVPPRDIQALLDESSDHACPRTFRDRGAPRAYPPARNEETFLEPVDLRPCD